MKTSDSDFLYPTRAANRNPSMLSQRLVILRNLISLGQVRVEVILPRKDRSLIYAAIQGHCCQDRKFHRFAIQHRQSSRQSETNRANICIGRVAKSRRARAENL